MKVLEGQMARVARQVSPESPVPKVYPVSPDQMEFKANEDNVGHKDQWDQGFVY